MRFARQNLSTGNLLAESLPIVGKCLVPSSYSHIADDVMELKVWVEGIQRIVCGVTESTTCQVHYLPFPSL